ncbi:MAG: cytochrome c family protein [Rhodopila sp.]|nr:cytochrome c family protein [Rhodopila sp.]
MRHMFLGGIVLAGIFGLGSVARAQDAAGGERVFRSQCSICHSPRPDRNIIGPSLFSVVGRHSGMVPGFHYSVANRSSGLVWDPATLDRYLGAPNKVVPGTLMTYPGLKDPHQRADLIAYLATLR